MVITFFLLMFFQYSLDFCFYLPILPQMSALRRLWAQSAVVCSIFFASSAYSGCLFEWGGRTPNPTYPMPEVESAIGIAAGGGSSTISMVLLPDRSVITWGLAAVNAVPVSATNVVSMAAGVNHCVVATDQGKVVSWGFGVAVYTQPAGLSGVTAVTAGDKFSAALLADGTVKIWGEWYVEGSSQTASLPESLSGVRAISAGSNHILILKSNGLVEVYGNGIVEGGENLVPAGLSDVVAVSGGYRSSLALRGNGTLVGWGNVSPPDPSPTGIVAIQAADTHGLALRANGTVLTWGYTGASNPATVPYSLNGQVVKAIAASQNYSLALLQSCDAPTVEPIQASPDLAVCGGVPVTLQQSASGDSGPFTYQWYRNGAEIEGATASTLLIPAPVNGDTYYCLVTSPKCSKSSSAEPVTIAVLATPAAPNKTFARGAGTSCKIRTTDIGQDLIFFAVGSSAQGAHVFFDADNIYYQPQAGNNNSDSFSYTVKGVGHSCTATGTITIQVEQTTAEARHIGFEAGELVIRFFGVPGLTYQVQKAGDASFAEYSTVLTTNAPDGGEFLYRESNPGAGAAYYRLAH
jgi:hypothetical protein